MGVGGVWRTNDFYPGTKELNPLYYMKDTTSSNPSTGVRLFLSNKEVELFGGIHNSFWGLPASKMVIKSNKECSERIGLVYKRLLDQECRQVGFVYI